MSVHTYLTYFKTCKYSFTLSRGDCTNQEYRASFEIDSSDSLTCTTLLGYYISDVQYHFSKCIVRQKGNKSIYQKGLLVATEIPISLHTWQFVAAPPWTRSAFLIEMTHDTALASSESPRVALLYLHETNIHGSHT